jgi:16S rRNA G966 N2-methylase RsmD
LQHKNFILTNLYYRHDFKSIWGTICKYSKRRNIGDVVLDPFGGTGVTAIEALARKKSKNSNPVYETNNFSIDLLF